MLARPSELARRVIGCAIDVHRGLGPGLLESSYEAGLVYEFTLREVAFKRQVPVPMTYKGVYLECGYRADFVVEGVLLLEIKSIDRLLPIHDAQLLTYLKLLDLHQGMLMNFNEKRLVDGLRNILR
jgi:GxxExxY protein